MHKLITAIIALAAATLAAAAADIIIPRNLPQGGKIALITPSTAQDSIPIAKTIHRLQSLGYQTVTYPHTFGKTYGSYSATDAERVSDIHAAFADTTVRAILCTRGGFGSAHMLPMLDTALIRRNPKWFIGYSDVSAIHALMRTAGVASIHGPMSGHLATEPADDPATAYLFDILTNGLPLTYTIAPSPYNHPGTATGQLFGGNLCVLNDLGETPWDMLNTGDQQDMILFIEDVSEKIHAIERMMLRLHQCGALNKLKGLIIGRFTDYKPDDDFHTMEAMLYDRLRRWGYYDADSPMPIVFGFPVGHVTANYPLVEGCQATLTVTPTGATLTMQ